MAVGDMGDIGDIGVGGMLLAEARFPMSLEMPPPVLLPPADVGSFEFELSESMLAVSKGLPLVLVPRTFGFREKRPIVQTSKGETQLPQI